MIKEELNWTYLTEVVARRLRSKYPIDEEEAVSAANLGIAIAWKQMDRRKIRKGKLLVAMISRATFRAIDELRSSKVIYRKKNKNKVKIILESDFYNCDSFNGEDIGHCSLLENMLVSTDNNQALVSLLNIKDIFEKMPRKEVRETMKKVFIENRTYRQAGKELGITEGGTYYRVQAGLKQYLKLLHASTV